jgi:hypothetical protein
MSQQWMSVFGAAASSWTTSRGRGRDQQLDSPTFSHGSTTVRQTRKLVRQFSLESNLPNHLEQFARRIATHRAEVLQELSAQIQTLSGTWNEELEKIAKAYREVNPQEGTALAEQVGFINIYFNKKIQLLYTIFLN